MAYKYTEKDCGCWIDGANGTEHAEKTIIGMVWEVAPTRVKDLTRAFTYGHVSEVLNNATEILQEHTDGGLVWHWEAGDLMLVKRTEMEA